MAKTPAKAPAKKKLSAKKETVKNLDVKAGKGSAVKGGGTSACTLTWKRTGKSDC